MKTIFSTILFIVALAFSLSACTAGKSFNDIPLAPVPNESVSSQTLSYRGQEYNGVMAYDKKAGIIVIDFFDSDHNPAKILRSQTAIARLTLPDATSKVVNFKNPAVKSYSSGTRRAKRQLRLKPKGETIYAKDDVLKNLSAFSLLVSVPIGGGDYLLNFAFH